MNNEYESPRQVLSMVRVSGDEQEDRTGIPRQLEDISRFLKRDNLILAANGEYRLIISGASVVHHPKFREMLERLSDPNIVGVVFSMMDRFFRPEFLSAYGILKPFETHKKLMFCDMGKLDPRDLNDMMRIQGMAQQAAFERSRIRERTLRGREIRRKDSDCPSNFLPQGIRFVAKDPNAHYKKGYFEYTPEAEKIKLAFSRILSGESYVSVASDLGFKSGEALRYRMQSRWWIGEKATLKKKFGQCYNDDGKRYQGKNIPREEGSELPPHIVRTNLADNPLISRTDYFAFLAMCQSANKRFFQRKIVCTSFLGQGVVHCPCGKMMTPKKGSHGHEYYFCTSKGNYNPNPCSYHGLSREVVDREIRMYLTLIQKQEKLLPSPKPAFDIKNEQKKLIKLKTKKLNFVYSLGDLDPDSQRQVKSKIAQLTQEITSLENQLANPPSIVPDQSELQRRFHNFKNLDILEQKRLVRETFLKIGILQDGSINMSATVLRPSLGCYAR